jgi:large subunit ribosomal protein L17
MRHRKAGLKLNRTPSHRNAMFRNMVTSLLKYERIRTTGAKAKEIRRWADHLITLAKRGDLHARRQALAIVREKEVVHKLFEQADERFGAASGGYTRVIKLQKRPGDAAPMSLVELIALQDTQKKKAKKKKTKTEGKQKKKAADKKAPAAAETVKPDKKEKTPAKTKDEPSKLKPESAVEDTKEDKPEKQTKSAPKKQTATAEKEDTPNTTTKMAPVEKTVKDEK